MGLIIQIVRKRTGFVGGPCLPLPIVELRREIKGKIRVAELRQSVTKVADPDLTREILEMNSELDHLYTLWALGEIQ